MSSDEEEPTSPVLPRDSDPGSSVSSELQQDEYEELLRYAVVTPKLDAQLEDPSTSHLHAQGPTESQHQTDPEAKDRMYSGRRKSSMHASPASPVTVKHSVNFHATAKPGQSPRRMSGLSDAPSDRSRPTSPNMIKIISSEMFISEANISQIENILDTWSNDLKINVLDELRKWKSTVTEQHKREIIKERENHAVHVASLKLEMDTMKELLQTYETSNQRKDEVIGNLCQVLERQKAKLEKMRVFTYWRLHHAEAKEEAQDTRRALQHYHKQLKKKVWWAWHSLVEKHWKEELEEACRLKAEQVCTCLSAEYEAKVAEHCEALEKAQAEIQRLRLERERSEENMKKAFMRGVCALNMEALSMFHGAEGRPEQIPVHHPHDPLPSQDEPLSLPLAHGQPYPSTSARLSPVHFDHPELPHSEADVVRSGVHLSREQGFPQTTVVHSSLPPGGITSSHKQASSRIVTASQQKPSKMVAARIAARTDAGKAGRSRLQVMGVAPPMSSVIVERHHPVTQLTIGQATAAKFSRHSQQGQTSTAGRGSSRSHSRSCHVHSVKVVE